MARDKILIVDDDVIVCEILKGLLEKENYQADEATGVDQALEALKEGPDDYFLILSDYNMPKKTGIDLLKTVKKLYPIIEVVMITGAGSEDVAIQALRLGAMDYIKKPILAEELLPIISKANELSKLRKDNVEYFNKILTMEDSRGEKIESFKIFMKGLEEDLVEGYSYIRKAYFFLKKLEQSVLKPELQEDLNRLLSDTRKKSEKSEEKDN